MIEKYPVVFSVDNMIAIELQKIQNLLRIQDQLYKNNKTTLVKHKILIFSSIISMIMFVYN